MKFIKVTLVTGERIKIAFNAIESTWEERHKNGRELTRFIRGISGTIYNIKENWDEVNHETPWWEDLDEDLENHTSTVSSEEHQEILKALKKKK